MNNRTQNGHKVTVDWTSSYITEEWIRKARIYRVDTHEGAEAVGRRPRAGAQYQGVIIPYYWPGETHCRNSRLRRDIPDYEQRSDGSRKEKAKYLGPPGRGNLAYFPPETDPAWLEDPGVQAFIVEGEKKAISLRRYFFEREEKALIVALPGVWNWRGNVGVIRDSNGHVIAKIQGVVSDIEKVVWRTRLVRILFDTNAITDESVNAARRELAKQLIRRGAIAQLLDLPAEEGINGVDDFLGKHGPDAFARFLQEAEGGKNLSGVSAFPLTDIGNAERIAARHGHNLRWNEVGKAWYTWDGRRLQRDEVLLVEAWAKETIRSIPLIEGAVAENGDDLAAYARKQESNDKIKAMLARLKAEPGVAIKTDEFDADPYLLNCNNGTLDLKTGELRLHKREDLITKLCPVDYDEAASAPRWLQFLNEVFDGDRELIDFIWQAIGYSLTGDTSAQALFVLHGMGANGKSVLLNTIRSLVGEYGDHTPIETFMLRNNNNMSNDLARLRGARLVTATETNEGHRLNEALIKQVTGGEPITARFLREEFFTFQPNFKLWFAVNHKPNISGTDYGLWRRVRLIPFNVQFSVDQRDEHLQSKLNAELPGILAWAVRGCHDWLENGFRVPKAVKAATEEYQRESDNVGEFIAERCVVGSEYACKAGDLFKEYERWCEDQGIRPGSSTLFGRRLAAKGFPVEHAFAGKIRTGIDVIRC